MNHAIRNYAPDGARYDSPFSLPGEIHARAERTGGDLAGEAQVVRDAFESQTNGMVNHTAKAGLNAVKAPFLTPWCRLIAVLEALYRGDFTETEKRLAHVEDESAPGLLKPIILALCGTSRGKEYRKGFHGREKHLYNKISEDRHFVKSVEMQLKDTLEAGEEYFYEFALLALKEIKELDEELALRLGLWILQQFYQEEWDYTGFLEDMKLNHRPSVVMRLSALVLTPEEREEGVKCWLLSLLFRCREGGLSREEAAEYLGLIGRLLENLPPQEEQEISQLLHLVGRELETAFSLTLAPVEEGPPLNHFPSVWAAFLAPQVKLDFPKTKVNGSSGKGNRHGDAPLSAGTFRPPPEPAAEPEVLVEEALDFTREITRHGLLSPPPLKNPEELRALLRTRPRYVGPEPWLDVVKQKRKQHLNAMKNRI